MVFLAVPSAVITAQDSLERATDTLLMRADSSLISADKTPPVMKPHFRSARGYRLQLLKTQYRDKAFLLKSRLLEALDHTRVYVTYQAPFYRVRVGNFITRAAADKFLRNELDEYKNVFIVKDKIVYLWRPPAADMP